MHYPIVIEPGGETTAFGVVIPDLPGCFSAGDSFDAAVTNAVDAATLWIEDAIDRGIAVPKPSPLDTVRADPAWRN